MTWIRTVSEEEAQGSVKREYEAATKRAGGVAEIVKALSLNTLVFSGSMRLYKAIMFTESPLPRKLRELIATVVSSTNECHY